MAYAQAQAMRRETPSLGLPPAIVSTGCPPRVFAKFPFKGLATETEQLSTAPIRYANSNVKKIITAWSGIVIDQSGVYKPYSAYQSDVLATNYEKTLSAIEGLNCSARDLREFMVVLPDFLGNNRIKAGIFLSALINAGSSEKYVVHTGEIGMQIHFFGLWNEKQIVVEGDIGPYSGTGMKDGSVTIRGNTGSSIGGEMSGGIITVSRNAGPFAGEKMSRGNLVVLGDVEMSAGYEMTGGSLWVKGNATGSAGACMKDGMITIDGNADSAAGGAMSGGRLIIGKNAGDYVGQDMTGGILVVGGNVSRCAGHRMKGGSIIVKGNTGNDAGNEMQGGNLTILGSAGEHLGVRMNGGSIVVTGKLVVMSDTR